MMDATGKTDEIISADEYPFSRPALMAGLRRHLAASTLRLLDIKPMTIPNAQTQSSFGDAGTTLRALSVGVLIDDEEQTIALLLKEPPVTASGRVLYGVGQREYGVYNRLAELLPMLVPALVAGNDAEGWFVLEALSGLRAADQWTPDDYREAVINLVAMHDRFHGLSESLETYPWLARPLTTDYDETIESVQVACGVLLTDNPLPPFDEPKYAAMVRRLAANINEISSPLRAETHTLVHGDYWAGNIGCSIDGRQMVFDWQLAAIGPAILDLVGFVQSTLMNFNPSLSTDEIIRIYREQYNEMLKPGWDDEQFSLLWDHALMWRFVVNWVGKLAMMPPENYAKISDSFRKLWIEPVMAAMERRLKASDE